MSLIQNERAKLAANALNTVGSGCVLIGVVTPTAAVIYGTAVVQAPGSTAALAGLFFFLLGIMLHLVAQLLLGGLKP